MLTRSLHGSILKVPKNIKTLLRLTPQITMRPGPYRMPGLEQRQALHQIKQTEITQILDGWAPEAPAAPKPTPAKPAAGGAAPVPTPAASSTSTLYPVV
jgi:hypothetical protein